MKEERGNENVKESGDGAKEGVVVVALKVIIIKRAVRVGTNSPGITGCCMKGGAGMSVLGAREQLTACDCCRM